MIHRVALSVSSVVILLIVATLLMGASCNKPPNAFIVSGQIVAAQSDAFLAVAKAYDAGLAARSITPAQYNAWKAVGQRLQLASVAASSSWQTAVAVNDATKITDARGRVAAVIAELAQWGLTVGVDVYALVGQKG